MLRVIGVLTIFSILSCTSRQTEPLAPQPYATRDYVTVGKMMDTVEAPYIVDVREGNKVLVFMGCTHQADREHPQFKAIEKYFREVRPEVTFNEGGPIADSVHYPTLTDAIRAHGETGALKYFSDSAGVKMLNGDLDARTEFATTLPKTNKNDLYLYYVMERIVIPAYYGANGNTPFETVFDDVIKNYFIKNGFPLTPEEQKLSYVTALYTNATGKTFDSRNFDIEAFDYVNADCKFCAIGRVSKMVRDSILLSKIEAALDHHDRVMVTFGHGHALAVEPALEPLVHKKAAATK